MPGDHREQTRWLVAASVAMLAAVWIRAHAQAVPGFTSDFDQLWAAARALLAGGDPYAVVGPGRAFPWKWPLYYPLPAVLLVTPLAPLEVAQARMVFGGLSAGLFTYAIFRDGWSRWPILLSVTFYVAVDLVQWSLLLAAAFFVPALGALVAAKPNLGIAVVAAARDRRTLWYVGASLAALGLVGLVVRPDWGTTWIDTVRSADHFAAPVQRPGGFLLLLAALRWRRPEARWFVAVALVPQAPSFYDQLLLVAVCTRWWEAAVLAAGSWAMFLYVGAQPTAPDYAAWGTLVGSAAVWTCHIPCLLLLLRRPNEGEAWWWSRPARVIAPKAA